MRVDLIGVWENICIRRKSSGILNCLMSFGVDLFQYSFHTTFSCSEILYFSSQVIHFLIQIKLKPDLNIHFPVADRFEKTFHLGEGKRI